MSRDKKRNEPNSLLGAIAVGVFAVASLGVGYLLGKEEGREEAREQHQAAASSSSSRTRARPANPPGAGGDGFTHPRVTNLNGSPYNGRLDGPAAAASGVEGQPSAASPPPDTDEDAHLCKVCLEAPNDHLFSPCHHQVCCGVCAAQMRECPICRRKIHTIIRVFKS